MSEILVGCVNEYPTIRRLADVSQTTVGYQQHVLTSEAVTCLYEVDRLRADLAAAHRAHVAELTRLERDLAAAKADADALRTETVSKAREITDLLDELAAAKALLREAIDILPWLPAYDDFANRVEAALVSKG